MSARCFQSDVRGFRGRLDRLASARSGRRPPRWRPATIVLGCGFSLLVCSAGAQSPASERQNEATAVTAGASTAGRAASAELGRLRISSQTWRRGGLGSRALVTFTLRNDNDYDVGDLEIACTFLRRDGSQLTERSRRLPEVVGMKSRRTFAGISFGVVNINAEQARCRLVAARRA
jgi:hypothetical protein